MSNIPQGPNLHVLQYLRGDPKPSWVRVISARALRIISIGYSLIWLILMEGLIDKYNYYYGTVWSYRILPFRDWTEEWRDPGWFGIYLLRILYRPLFELPYGFWTYTPFINGALLKVLEILIVTPAAWLAVTLFFAVILTLGLAPIIRRGRASAARFGIICLYPALLMAPTMAAFLMTLALLNLFGLFGFNNRILVLLIVPGLLFGFLTLLLIDLRACLRWISRAPLAEMPKREFM